MIQYQRVTSTIGPEVALAQAPPDLAQAIAEADIRVLLMCLVHLTGDMRWLAPPYSPKRDVRLIPDRNAGVPESLGDTLTGTRPSGFGRGVGRAREGVDACHRARRDDAGGMGGSAPRRRGGSFR